jgi:hypothetical protein
MAKKNYFTYEEIVLCTYAAMYDVRDFGGVEQIEAIKCRSMASIMMKIQNIAAMLDEAGIQRYSVISPLTGLPHGRTGRTTNWDVVELLCRLPRKSLLDKCRAI